MKLAKLTAAYPGYLRLFYEARPHLAERPYAEQMAALFHDAFAWSDAWRDALTPLGYEVFEQVINIVPAQQAWARESGLTVEEPGALVRIAVQQLKQFRPEVLWYDHHDAGLLRLIRGEVPSIRRVLGWVGSAVPVTEVWRDIDVILSCAPESVDRLRSAGHRVEHLNHGFDARITGRLAEGLVQNSLLFVGSIIPAREFHFQRERILEAVAGQVPLEIHSPALEPPSDSALGRARALVMGCARELLPTVVLAGLERRAPRWGVRQVNPCLGSLLRPPLYGLAMYQATRNSRVGLNIHADSSPEFAGNMRMFETTGVGTCLLTDWRENLPRLFDPDREVVAYRTAGECAERARWLLDHPEQCAAIGVAGRRRVLAEHTFAHRAAELHELLRKAIR